MTTIYDIIKAAADKYGVPVNTMLAFGKIESGFDPNAYNASHAAGLFQFIPSTARGYFGPDGDRFNPAQSADAAARLLRKNNSSLRLALGREPTAGESYLAHQQGAGGAAALLADPSANAITVLTNLYTQLKYKDPAGAAYDAVTLNGGDADTTAQEFASHWTSMADTLAAAGTFPEANVPVPAQKRSDIPNPMPRPVRDGTDVLITSDPGGLNASWPADDIYDGLELRPASVSPTLSSPHASVTVPGPTSSPLGAINALAPGVSGAGPSPALGYANGGPSQSWNLGFPPAQPSPSIAGPHNNPATGLPYANPAMGPNYGAPAGGYRRSHFPGADPSSMGWGGPQDFPAGGMSQMGYATPFGPGVQTGNVYGFGGPAGAGNLPPLSDFESQMARVPSMVIPKYIAVTHRVPNPAYAAQFGPVDPPMTDFGHAPGQLGALPATSMSDYLLDKTPPPLPASAAPPLPTLQDPEAIRAILVPALQAAARQRAQAALQAQSGTDVTSRLASNGW